MGRFSPKDVSPRDISPRDVSQCISNFRGNCIKIGKWGEMSQGETSFGEKRRIAVKSTKFPTLYSKLTEVHFLRRVHVLTCFL